LPSGLSTSDRESGRLLAFPYQWGRYCPILPWGLWLYLSDLDMGNTCRFTISSVNISNLSQSGSPASTLTNSSFALEAVQSSRFCTGLKGLLVCSSTGTNGEIDQDDRLGIERFRNHTR
jgi:hypothetical protein